MQVSCCERHVLTVDTSGKSCRYCTHTGMLTEVPSFTKEEIINLSCGETFDAFVTSPGKSSTEIN